MRLFIAVPLPADVRRRLASAVAAAGGVDDAIRWVAEDHLHLTLKFLGDVDDHRLSDLTAALTGACAGHRAFMVDVSGFGAFPPARPPRVLWAGLDPVPPLELLQDGVERAMAAVGFAMEGQPFRPHVTVGRVRRGRSGGRTAQRLADAEHHDAFRADRVELIESTLGSHGPRYTTRHAVPLAD